MSSDASAPAEPSSCSLPAPALTYPINGTQVNTLVPQLQWSSTSAGGYYLQISTVSSFSSVVYDGGWFLSSNPPSVPLDFNLAVNTTYYWRVASYCDSSNDYGGYSAPASFHIGNVTGPFPNPPSLSAPVDGATEPIPVTVLFSWGNVSGATGWQLRLYTSLTDAQNDSPQRDGLTWGATWSTSWANSAHSDFGAHDYQGTYYWRMMAQNAAGWGPLSPIRSLVVGKSPISPLVREARLDLGMPYDTNRGCSSPSSGCGGPYHGFYQGVCTDLALDAYTAGGPFNIQAALHQDYLANRGRYRWADARNADDMRRYIVADQQFLPHSQAYQPGDIAFFDWNGDGVTDHVLIVTTVDGSGRPQQMADASGSFSLNPSGRAFEHAWSLYYDQHVQGHGRVNGLSHLAAPATVDPLQTLQISVDTQSVGLRLVDATGKSTSSVFDENLVASNVDAFIPYIPGGVYTDTGAARLITVTQPLLDTGPYVLELQGQAPTTYHLEISTWQDAAMTASQLFTPTIGLGETDIVSITVSAPGGVIQLDSATATVTAPSPAAPDGLALAGLVNTAIHGTLALTETGGAHDWSGVTITATDLTDPAGDVLAASRLSVAPTGFTIAAGHSQTASLTVDITNITPGLYLGGLQVASANAAPRSVPLAILVVPHNMYLPLVIRN